MSTCNDMTPETFPGCKEMPACTYSFDLRDFLKNNRVLVLPVKKVWFDLMVTGEKPTEYRKPTKFIIDRLIDKKTGESKEYDYVLINNGYGYHLPFFIAKYEGFGTGYNMEQIYSDGSTLQALPEDYNIFLGEIIIKANLK